MDYNANANFAKAQCLCVALFVPSAQHAMTLEMRLAGIAPKGSCIPVFVFAPSLKMVFAVIVENLRTLENVLNATAIILVNVLIVEILVANFRLVLCW